MRADNIKHVVIVLGGKLVSFIDPLGARMVLGVLEAMQEKVVAFLQDRLIPRDAILKLIEQEKPDIIWISIQPTAQETDKFISALSEKTSNPIILGNIGARILLLEEFNKKNIFTVYGQGEDAVAALIEYFKNENKSEEQLSRVSNLTWWSKNNQLNINKLQPALLAGKIHPSDLLLKEAISRGDVITARSSSGCSGYCTFCTIKTISKQHAWRRYPLDILYNWLQKVVVAGGAGCSIFLTDDNLADDIAHFQDVISVFVDINNKYGSNLTFNLSARADCLHSNEDSNEEQEARRKIWRYAVASGLKTIFLGLESGADTQLKRFGKKISAKQNFQVLEFAAELGIELDVGFIPIDPLMEQSQWQQEMLDNVKLIRSCYNKINSLSTWLAPLRVYKDTGYYKLLLNKGLLKYRIPWSEEYVYRYMCPDVDKFVFSLGPLLCIGQNDYFKFKKELKVVRRFPLAMADDFAAIGKKATLVEIAYVENLLKNDNTKTITDYRWEFVSDIQRILHQLKELCEPHKQQKIVSEISTSIVKSMQVLNSWGNNQWIPKEGHYL